MLVMIMVIRKMIVSIMRTMMLIIIMIMIIKKNMMDRGSYKRAESTVTTKTPPTGPTSLADFAWAQVRNSHRFPMNGPNLRLS